jgi:isopentenyl diphosphate isomerase/L-lactate dehydrogenase-like FMN-dependent dehydrogenase
LLKKLGARLSGVASDTKINMGGDWRRECFSIAGVRARANRVLPRAVFDFTDGGAEDEWSLRRNEAAFHEISLLPRPLRGAATRDLSIELFGRRLSMPVIVGPTGIAGLMWPDGEVAAARAASAAGVAYCLSHGSVCTLEHLAASGASPRWMQVFIYRDRGFTAELADRAAAAGYEALVLTIDNQLTGNRDRDQRNGFTIPPRFRLLDMAAMAPKLPWLWRMRRELPRITFGNYVRPGEAADAASLARRMTGLLDPSMSWRDVDWLRGRWKGPLILKGVLHPDDAREACAQGVDGVVVSNHGGRQLDGAISSIEALPRIVDAIAGRMPVLLDGGVRRGADVLKAVALGATCCLIARPQLWGLAIAGEAGVAHVLEILHREIDRAMGLMGASRMADVTRDQIAYAAPSGAAGGHEHA